MSTDLEITPQPTTPTLYTASRNPAAVYLSSLKSEHSRRAMRNALERIAKLEEPPVPVEAIPWGALRYAQTQAIRARLIERYGGATANQALAALRGVLKAAWRLDQMTADEYMRATDLSPVSAERPDQAAGRALSYGEIMALVGACADGTPLGVRDAAILGLAYSGGLRRAELVGLNVEDYDPTAAVIRVKGKRNRVRSVPVSNGAQAALEDWITLRREALGESGPLFVHMGKGRTPTPERLTDQAIYYVCRDRGEQAGIAPFSPHDLRRTFAGDLLDAGADMATVQKLMGHSSPTTTAGYDRRGERAKKDAVKKLHFPYQRAK